MNATDEKLDLVFLCAGRGVRVGLSTPKQFLKLRGRPVMTYPLTVYEKIPHVGRKIIVHESAEAERVSQILQEANITNFVLVPGGATRQESVRNGLAAVGTERVLTHNAALAFVTPEMVQQVIDIKADCVTTCTGIKDNLVGDYPDGLRPVSRKELRVVNSPQSFQTALFKTSHEQAEKAGQSFNTDAELMLHYGHTVHLVQGPTWSFKITDKVDLALAETILGRPDLFPEVQRAVAESELTEVQR